MPTKPRRSVLTPGILLLVVALAVVGYFVLRQGKPLLIGSGCQAGRGAAAVSLDPEQAAIASTIAGVAHQQSMPSRADHSSSITAGSGDLNWLIAGEPIGTAGTVCACPPA
ncbi:MAG TPA: hypothetical protein VGF32_28385 [Streptosporangiaceae bacterium]